jgi:pilus assembly protein CpaE
MMEKAIKIMLRARDETLARELHGILASIPGVRLLPPLDEGPWDVCILDITDNPEQAFDLVREMQVRAKAEHFFLTAQNADPQVLIQAIKLGIKGFFPQPLNHEDVRTAIAQIRNEKFASEQEAGRPAKMGRIINCFGTKGGIGTTTIAVNLAASLAGLDDRPSVVLVDMNLHFGEVPLFLGMDPLFDWVEILKNISRLDKTYMMSTLLKHPAGMYVLPAPARFSDDLAIKQQNIEDLFQAMRHVFDYIVVDIGQSFDGTAKTLIRLSDTLLLVTVLSLPCLINTKKLMSTLEYLGYPAKDRIKILVNRYVKNSEISLKDSEESMDRKVFATIPNEYDTTMRAINLGKPLRLMAPAEEISENFDELAHALAGKAWKKKLGLFFRSRK